MCLFFWIFEFYFIFLYSRFLLVIHFINISVYMSISIAQFSTPPPPPLSPLGVHTFVSASVSQFLPWKPVHLYHFSSFHIYALIYDICFSLSDLLHSVWQSLDPSTSLQMTQFRSFLRLSNIPLYSWMNFEETLEGLWMGPEGVSWEGGSWDQSDKNVGPQKAFQNHAVSLSGQWNKRGSLLQCPRKGFLALKGTLEEIAPSLL